MSTLTLARLRRLHARVVWQAEHLLDWAGEPETELDRRAERVSRWSVGEQLAHMLLVDAAALERLAKALAGQADPAARPTLVGRAILATGWIPRGLGRAPENVQPGPVVPEALRRDAAALHAELRALGDRLPEIATAPGRARHFLFGDLTAAHWLSFIDVHQRHHFKIIQDIRRATGASEVIAASGVRPARRSAG